MAETLPFLISETNYRLACPFSDDQILFDVRWNSRDQGWYLDIYESNDEIIALNIKIVTGISLGRRSTHSFFENYRLMAMDTSGAGVAPGFDDLGMRVVVVVQKL